MLTFLESNFSLALGSLLVVVVTGLRAAVKEPGLRRDLGGALMLLVAHLVLRGLDALLPPTTLPTFEKLVTVAWMLALAWGVIRAGVGLALFFMRLRSRATPKILRDVIDVTLYALVAFPVLKAELAFDLTGVLATSAVVSVVLGLALQETLSNLFAGLSLQVEEPFEVGDLVTIGGHTGVVIQVGWRAMRIQTAGRKVVTLPNNLVAKEAVLNFTRGGQPIGLDHTVGLSYELPPNLVRDAVLEVLREIPGVLPDPEPTVRPVAFDELSVRYQVRFFVPDTDSIDPARDALFTRLWYRLQREGVDLPYPQRTVQVRQAPAPTPTRLTRADIRAVLQEVDLFAPLSEAALEQLCAGVAVRHFGRGETVLREGEQGRTFYIVARGAVSVRAARSGAEVSRLERGQYFGEMSLLTGAPRSATVVASDDVELLEMDRSLFAALFQAHPDLARLLSAILAQRRSQLRAVATAGSAVAAVDAAPEAHHIFARLRQIFRVLD